jgi:MoxR-like ATPase
VVVLTSNSFREFSDALKRRCIHLYIGYPDRDRELAIISLKAPGIREALARQLVEFVQAVRKQKLRKAPSIAESIDWARSLMMLGVDTLNEETVKSTITVLLKYQGDVDKVQAKIKSLLPG